MSRPFLVMLSRQGRSGVPPATWAALNEVADVRSVRRGSAPDRAEAVRLLAGADLLGATNLCLPVIDRHLLDAVPTLRGIVLYATGYDHLDVDLLTARGVGLSVVPDYGTVAVAEHAVAMMMALACRVHLANDRSRGAVPADVSLRGMELAGRTVGIIGVGRIGGRVAALAAGLGMAVLGTDTDPVAVARARRAGREMVGLAELLRRSDVVSVCASHHLGAPAILGPVEIAAMRPGALLVNVARSALVDSRAAIQAARLGRLRGYAVDDVVCDPVADGDVLREGRVLQTGHSAWWRDETLRRGGQMWADRMLAAARGTPLDAVTWPASPRPTDLPAGADPPDLTSVLDRTDLVVQR